MPTIAVGATATRSRPMANASRLRATASSALIAALALAFSASRAAAQDPTAAGLDSLRERLRRAEEAIELLRQQLAAQASSAVQTKSRLQAELTGRVLVNGFSNSGRVNNVDVPQFALPEAPGTTRSSLGAAVRQSSLGIAVSAPRVLGGEFVGDVNVDFYGGQLPSTGGRHFPLVRIRTARARLGWRNGELLAGQESPLIAELSPVSLASLGTPGFVGAGNLWLWLPQLRLTGEVGSGVRLGVQGAVLAPTSSDAAAFFDTDADIAERARRPYLQGRVRVRWGDLETGGELGVGAHRGWLAPTGAPRATSEAYSVDLRIPVLSLLEIRGEAYTGRAVRGLGGGGIGQNFDVNSRPLRDRGGWAQLNIKPGSLWELGTGCGVDDPKGTVPAATGRLRNVACEAHTIVRPGGPLVVGFEYRKIRTTMASGKANNDHVNLGVGFEF